MPRIPSPFGGDDEATFDDVGTFVPEHLPEPGPFFEDHDVLVDDEHVAVHEIAREVFEARGVYDATFGYNLARLNLDTRHPGAGLRYAIDGEESAVLRVEFTPTTAFCPQAESLSVGAFRALNGESERHDYDRVTVRVSPTHHRDEQINEQLAGMDADSAEAVSEDGDARTVEEMGTGSDDAGVSADGSDSAADAPTDDTAPF